MDSQLIYFFLSFSISISFFLCLCLSVSDAAAPSPLCLHHRYLLFFSQFLRLCLTLFFLYFSIVCFSVISPLDHFIFHCPFVCMSASFLADCVCLCLTLSNSVFLSRFLSSFPFSSQYFSYFLPRLFTRKRGMTDLTHIFPFYRLREPPCTVG